MSHLTSDYPNPSDEDRRAQDQPVMSHPLPSHRRRQIGQERSGSMRYMVESTNHSLPERERQPKSNRL